MTSQRQERVSAILANATTSKNQLDVISQQLSAVASFVPLVLSQPDTDTIISSNAIQANLRDTENRIKSLYTLTNLVSLLLDTHQTLLGSDIKALQDQLVVLEKACKNQAFLMADGGTYSYGYIESFTDQLGRDSFPWPVPDRGLQSFNDVQQATIRTDEGALVLAGDINLRYGLTAQIIKSNAATFITSDTGVGNATSATSLTGWRLAVASSSPIAAPFPEIPDGLGAMVQVAFDLNGPSPASEIQMTPFSDSPIYLEQLTTFASSSDTIGTPQLSSRILIDKLVSVHFPLQPIDRFTVTLSQPTYTRSNTYANMEEEQYRKLSLATKSQLANKAYRFRYVTDVTGQEFYPVIVNMATQPATSLVFNQDLKTFQTKLGPYTMWNPNTQFERTLLNFFTQSNGVYTRLFQTAVGSASQANLSLLSPAPSDPPPATALPPVVNNASDPGYTYQYTLGLRYITIGSDLPIFKGVFVSKPIPCDGDMGEVRLKVDDEEYSDPNTNRDSNVLTSIEYSVSNQSGPQNESDWIPILPVGTTFLQGERLFPNITGRCNLRFQATLDGFVNVYKNGYQMISDPIYDPSGNFITGVALTTNLYTSDDILTAEYTPGSDQMTVDFTTGGFADPPLATAHDSEGSGEAFSGTSGTNNADLKFFPYIDASQVASALYQPITVILQDGTTVPNVTNYVNSGSQLDLPASGYYYTNSGSVLLFSAPVTQPFRVYYQYLQNNVRMRAVLRANSTTFVSPKVLFMHIKGKTRRSLSTSPLASTQGITS